MRLIRTLVTALAITHCTPAKADLATQMDQMFSTLSNVNVPGSFSAQARGTISGGGLYVRSKIVNASLFHIEPPGFRAGCGGLDFFAGSFSWANSEQLQLLGQAVAANAAGYAFHLAMKQLCPDCMNVISYMISRINELNRYAGNSCQLAQGLVNDTLSAATGKKYGDASLINIFDGAADVFESITTHDGQTSVGSVQANNPQKYQEAVTGNLVWRELRRRTAATWIGGSGNALTEIMMNVTGTVIVDAGIDAKSDDIRIQVIPGNPKLLEAMLQGEPVTIYRCSDHGVNECLTLVPNANVVLDQGFRDRVFDFLVNPSTGLIASIYNDTVILDAAARDLVAAMPASAGSMMVRLSSLSPDAARTFADEASMQIAIEMTRQLSTALLESVRIATASLDDAYQKQVAELVDKSDAAIDRELTRLTAVYGNVFDLLKAYNQFLAVLPTGDYGLTTRAIPGI